MIRFYYPLGIMLSLLLSAGVSRAQSLPTRTIVDGTTLISDTTWTLAGSPYEVLGDVRVPLDVTLTIEAGVEVRFAARDTANLAELFEPSQSLQACHNNAVELIVDGSLEILGSAGAPVVLRSTLDLYSGQLSMSLA